MDEKAMVEWSETAQELARVWFPSMRSRSRVKLDEDDIRDFLIDLWIGKGGEAPEFEEVNRGQLYSYALTTLGRSRDTLKHADPLSDVRQAGRGEDEAFEEDRLGFLSYSEDEDDGLDPAARIEKAELREAIGERLEELAAIRDMGLSVALAEIFGVTDRRGRSFASEVRREKMLALIVDAARERGMKASEVKKLAVEIAKERRQRIECRQHGDKAGYDEIEAFEEMMGLTKPAGEAATIATTEKTCLQRRKSAPAMPMVPIPQQAQVSPVQLELV